MPTFYRNRWLLAFLLILPVAIFYAGHYAHNNGVTRIPSGLVLYDMPYYLSNAREHFDDGKFHLLYSNPFSERVDSKRIYFQPLTFFMALLWYLFSINPVAIFIGIGFAASFLFMRVLVQIYDELFGLDTPAKALGLPCFAWGGGLLALAGIAAHAVSNPSNPSPFFLDPFDGWWFLNLGRNMVFPTEAFYHLLVFLMALQFVRGKMTPGMTMLFFLAMSHPFTGAQFLLIVNGWLVLEKFVFKNPDVKFGHIGFGFVTGVLTLAYYLVYLPMDPEHKSVMEQWTVPFNIPFLSAALGYALVAVFAWVRLRKMEWFRSAFAAPFNRLLAIWAIVSFLLEKHEWFIKPHQPAHFTRGYTWAALFLLGAPVLIGLFDKCLAARAKALKIALSAGLVGVFLIDNALWLGYQTVNPAGIYYTKEDKEVMTWVETSKDIAKTDLLVSNDDMLSYYLTVTTPLKVVYGHQYCTPFARERIRDIIHFFHGERDPWPDRDLLIIENFQMGKTRPLLTVIPKGAVKLFENASYRAYRRPASLPNTKLPENSR